jgi:TRAP-type mannitol/chloroaromatic compound transport system permease small subunit
VSLELPATNLSRRIDPLLTKVGESISWLWLILLLIIVGNVITRHVFGEGYIELEEIQWHIYSAGFLLGLSYAFQADAHIRVDVVLDLLRPRLRAWLELYGLLLALLPFIVLVLWYSVPFVQLSWNLSEVSQAPGGLPYRWLIKAVLPLGFLLLLLAWFSRLTRVWCYLFGSALSAGKQP